MLKNLSFSTGWISVAQHFHWNLSMMTKSENSISSVQIQIKTKSQFGFEFLDLVDFGGAAFSMESFPSRTHLCVELVKCRSQKKCVLL